MNEDTLEKLSQRLKEIDGGVILDVATGKGEFLHSLLESLKDYDKAVAIDNFDKAINAAKEFFKEKPVEVLKMDALELDFPDNSFDTVGISNSLHHFNEVDTVLAEMWRVLKPGGHFLVTEMHCDKGQTEAQMTHVIMHHWWGELDSRLGIVHNKTYTTKGMKKIFGKLKFQSSEIYEFSFPMENPKDEKLIGQLIKMTDPYVDRLKDHPDCDMLKSQAEEIKKRLQEIGYAPAARIFFIGVK